MNKRKHTQRDTHTRTLYFDLYYIFLAATKIVILQHFLEFASVKKILTSTVDFLKDINLEYIVIIELFLR